MRFGLSTPRGPWSHVRGGGWIATLLVLAAGVMLLMRALERPESAERLGQALAMPAAAPDDRPPPSAAPLDLPGDPDAWRAVRDNALFLPEEQTAWFALLEHVRSAPDASAALPIEVAYAQLVSQPDAYRGRLVRVRGAIVREVVKRVPKNDLGLDAYHQLVVAPRGGGEWPIIVYALELPDGFPRGDGLREPTVVDGLFFKVWSFADDQGPGLAPVVVARTIAWQPRAPATNPAPSAPMGLGASLLAAAAFAAGVVAWVVRQTRRPRHATATADDDTTRRALDQLRVAEGEP